MIGRNNSSLIGLVHVGRVIMIIFLTMSSCQRQVSCHKDGIEIIDILNKDCPIQIDLYDIVDSIKYIPLETKDDFICQGLVLAIGKDIILARNRIRDGDIFIYDRKTGKGLKKINREGQGGEEYTFIQRIVLDEKQN